MARRFGILILVLAAVVVPVGAMMVVTPPPDLPSAEPPDGLVLKPGTYRPKWVIPDKVDDNYDLRVLIGSAAQWEGVESRIKVKPRLASQSPIYGGICFYRDQLFPGERDNMYFAMDESKGTGTGFDRIIIDTDRDGDLTNNKPVTAKSTAKKEDYVEVAFSPAFTIPLNKVLPGLENAKTAAVDITMYLRPQEQYGWVALRGHWVGEIESNKGKIPFKLVDRTGSGYFGDAMVQGFTDDGTGDVILFDWSGKGDFESGKQLYACSLLRKGVKVGGKAYSLKCSRSGDRLEIAHLDIPMSRLALKVFKIGGSQVTAMDTRISGEWGTFTLRGDGRLLEVPPGTYTVKPVTLSADDGAGTVWSCMYAVDGEVNAVSDKATALSIGGTVKLEIAPDAEELKLQKGQDTQLPLVFRLSGKGTLSGIRGKTASRATVTIRDPAGKEVFSRRQGYG